MSALSNSGIYIIKNTVNGCAYIGKAQRIDCRWRSHRNSLDRGTHCNAELQSDWSLMGNSAFGFSVLELMPVGAVDNWLQIAERRYIGTFTGLLYNHSLATEKAQASASLLVSDKTTAKVLRGVAKGDTLGNPLGVDGLVDKCRMQSRLAAFYMALGKLLKLELIERDRLSLTFILTLLGTDVLYRHTNTISADSADVLPPRRTATAERP